MGIKGAIINLSSGEYFDYENLDKNEYSVHDIAKGLSNTCRYTGQCNGFYSVAEHSVLCSYLVKPQYAFEALMHDAHEAFIGDVNAPLKSILPDYKALERRVQSATLNAFGIKVLHESVKQADLQMLYLEKIKVMMCWDDWDILDGVEMPNITISHHKPLDAERMFKNRFNEVS